ncbi:rod shape-determining protein MreD [Nostoc sp. FACHB-87]|uniref:Rod shape-determining protein MreD n=1 Tax=Nostoc piscinale CENA21 TaxID=224013 RepID=A0A0M4T5F0_9NOSO|nr:MULTISPECIES: rod shape-determining protein MreD [Nostocales]ALF55482.1 rod shape-determining protein MreD [Nostoc piscinale CENA21]MBD2300732.1 rod shape-determining protein MreD [Nostoc sp. FACHB-190]MBD2458509.1 rod shape-determining protein MreD [Nostoc sp. FACHB-87]MBD2478659.1 rod shape-determining protein MreD [Anabaena sp. FACHB-83]MBD2489144.1 rod shape-determining protein MreD [Aulosira sp. FACHB-615]
MKIPSFNGRKSNKPKAAERKSKSKAYRKPIARWHPRVVQLLDLSVTVGSVLLCLLLLPTRFPGTELLGLGPNWLLIWVVAWSIKRSVWEGAIAGIVLGLLQDALTSPDPTHAVTLGLVGLLTGLVQKQRFIQEDFISIALIVFIMAILSESIFGLQLSLTGDRKVEYIWAYYQRVALASAILSSLWAPVVYYPLNLWWQKRKAIEQ